MDNAKSIIDIEVNDDQFKRFYELYQKYQSDLGSMPGKMRGFGGETKKAGDTTDALGRSINNARENIEKLARATVNSNKTAESAAKSNEKNLGTDQKRVALMEDLTDALAAHAALLNHGAEQREKTLALEKRQAKAEDDANKKQAAADKQHNAALEKRQKYIKEMSSNLSSMMGKTASIGFGIAKWGTGIGLALAGGSFFGMDRLGTAATADRSTARALGVSSGELRAWRTDFAPYGNPDGVLAAANNAYSDPHVRATVERAGVDPAAIRQGNTSQIAEQTLRGLSDFFNRNQGPNAQQIWESRGFNSLIGFNEMRQFAGASREEQEQVFRNIRRDSGTLGNSDPTLKAWQDFAQQLTRAGQQIKATFLDGLENLTGPMANLSSSIQNVIKQFMGSGAFNDLVQVISRGLNDLAQSFKDGSAQDAIKGFIGAISTWVKDGTLKDDLEAIEAGLHRLATAFKWIAPGNDKTPEGRQQQTRHNILKTGGTGAIIGGTVGAIAGSVVPGAGTAIGGMAGAAVGGSVGTLIAGTKDYKYLGYKPVDFNIRDRLYRLAKGSGFVADDDAKVLSAIGSTESRGDAFAVSNKGAQGLMQLTPAMQKALNVSDPFDESQSMAGAAKLYTELSRHFNGDMTKVIAGYNAGQPAVDRAIARYGEAGWLSHMSRETRDYVDRVNANMSVDDLSALSSQIGSDSQDYLHRSILDRRKGSVKRFVEDNLLNNTSELAPYQTYVGRNDKTFGQSSNKGLSIKIQNNTGGAASVTAAMFAR